MIAAFSGFSGAGAVLLGEWLGWRHAGACDRDPFCRAVIGTRLPGVPLYDDMENVPWETAWSDCSPEDGRASRTASRASDSPTPTTGMDGDLSSPPFAVVDPTSRSWKTSQESFLPMAADTGPDASLICPASGTMRNGWCWERTLPAPTIAGSACGSSPGDATWPTPCASDAASAANRTSGRTDPESRHHDGLTLTDAVRLFPAESECASSPTAPPTSSIAGERLWPTPTTPNGGRKAPEEMSLTGRMPDGSKRQVDLEHAVKLWPTPLASDASKGGLSFSRGNPTLKGTVALWPTPNATEANDGETAATWEARRAQVLATGINGNGMGVPLSIAVQQAGETGTKLNPAWVAMLLGWPPRWTGLPAAAIARLRQENRSARASLRGPARTTRAATTSCERSATDGTSPVPSPLGASS